jgi:hypothetical protein
VKDIDSSTARTGKRAWAEDDPAAHRTFSAEEDGMDDLDMVRRIGEPAAQEHTRARAHNGDGLAQAELEGLRLIVEGYQQ